MQRQPSMEAVLAKIKAAGVPIPPGPVTLGTYGDSEEPSQELISLIIAGRKRAGTSLLWAYETEEQPVPRPGDIEIVLDHRNEPRVIARITGVAIEEFRNVSVEHAMIEGEGDGSLEHWRAAHWEAFGIECARLGREPRDDILVVCSVFEVLKLLPKMP